MSHGLFYTGEVPLQHFGSEFGSQKAFDQLSYSTSRALWAGCLDAPDFVPNGSTRGSVIQGELFVAPTSSNRYKD
jgi:hypothetical protein